MLYMNALIIKTDCIHVQNEMKLCSVLYACYCMCTYVELIVMYMCVLTKSEIDLLLI